MLSNPLDALVGKPVLLLIRTSRSNNGLRKSPGQTLIAAEVRLRKSRGCSRCLDVCPANALLSQPVRARLDPKLVSSAVSVLLRAQLGHSIRHVPHAV